MADLRQVIRSAWTTIRYFAALPFRGHREFIPLRIVVQAPPSAQIRQHEFYLVASAVGHKWAVFKCPCRCGTVISLALRDTHTPHWKMQINDRRPTLHPSVWQKVGCKSHFWIRDGAIDWCKDE